MKTKRDYRQPAMVVVGLQARNRLLSGSDTQQAGVQNYDWHNEGEE